ncbi:MAG: hypothetical protein GYA21_00150 [Myxococcales bacterium]|nr:hypothetical protein [Myxococcales bacterium]
MTGRAWNMYSFAAAPGRAMALRRFAISILICLTASCERGPACRGPADCPSGSRCRAGRCEYPFADRDGDGLPDALDPCPDLDPGEELWKLQLSDRDGDGVGDVCDVCPEARDPGQRDADGDGRGDACADALGENESANDSVARLLRLPFDVPLDGYVGLPADGPDRDLFLFSAEEGEGFSFSAAPWPSGSRCDPVLAVRDLATFGQEFFRASDDDGQSRAARLDIVAPRAGDYVLEIGHFANWFNPAEAEGGIRFGYRLRACRGLGPEEELPLDWQNRMLTIPSGRLRSFLLRPTAPTMIEVAARGAGLADPEIGVQDVASGRILAWQDDRPDCPGSKDARLLLCLDEKPVRLWVGHLGLGGAPADIELSLHSARPPPAPTRLERLTAAGTALFALAPGAGPRRIRVVGRGGFSPALRAFACPKGAVPDTPARCDLGAADECGMGFYAEAGVSLYMEVSARAASGCMGPFHQPAFTVEELAAKAPAELAPGSTTITLAPGELGSFAFAAQPDQRLVFQARLDGDPAARPWLQLRRQDGTLLARAATAADRPESGARLVWIHPLAEELRLLLGDERGGARRARLDFLRQDVDLAPLAEGDGQNDDLGQAQDAGPIPFLLAGSVGGDDPADVFLLSTPPGAALSVRSWAGAPEPPDTILTLFDGAGRALLWSDDAEDSRLARLPPLAVARAEEFYLRIEARRATPYRLEVSLERLDPNAPVPPRYGDLLINEVLLSAGGEDVNGDGALDDGDQYLELASLSPLLLDVSDTWLVTRLGFFRFPVDTVLEPGEVILVFNAPAAPAGFPVRVFGRGGRAAWFEAGYQALRVYQGSAAGWLPEPLEAVSLSSTAAAGESLNRLRDLDPERILRPHRFVVGSVENRSPGRRADGREFAR